MSSSLPDIFPTPEIERVSAKTIGNSLLAVLNLEKGIFYTVWAMIKNPGAAMRRYLFIDRSRFIEPTKFLVLTVPVFLFLTLTFFPDTGFFAGFEEGLAITDQGEVDPRKQAFAQKMIKLFKDYANLMLLVTVPITAVFTRVLFRKYMLNFGEHLVINAFLYGFLTFMTILLLPTSLIAVELNLWLNTILYLGYMTYFFQSFFQFSWWRAIVNTGIIYLSSFFITFFILMIVVVFGLMLIGY